LTSLTLEYTSLQHGNWSLQTWSIDMKMNFNTTKCKVMHFSRKKLKTETSYNLTGQQLQQATHFSNLCMDNRLNWMHQIKHVKSKIAQHSRILIKLRYYTDLKMMKQLYFTLIYSYLNFCLAWLGIQHGRGWQACALSFRQINSKWRLYIDLIKENSTYAFCVRSRKKIYGPTSNNLSNKASINCRKSGDNLYFSACI
jgi:hypothetical protein